MWRGGVKRAKRACGSLANKIRVISLGLIRIFLDHWIFLRHVSSYLLLATMNPTKWVEQVYLGSFLPHGVILVCPVDSPWFSYPWGLLGTMKNTKFRARHNPSEFCLYSWITWTGTPPSPFPDPSLGLMKDPSTNFQMISTSLVNANAPKLLPSLLLVGRVQWTGTKVMIWRRLRGKSNWIIFLPSSQKIFQEEEPKPNLSHLDLVSWQLLKNLTGSQIFRSGVDAPSYTSNDYSCFQNPNLHYFSFQDSSPGSFPYWIPDWQDVTKFP